MVGFAVSSPARLDDCHALAPPTRFGRKVTTDMWLNAQTAAFHSNGELVAIGYLYPLPENRFEFCLAATVRAKAHMRRLIRIAHLTFSRLAQTGAIVSARVRSGNKTGQRMARLAGFHPDPDTPELWIWDARKDDG